MSRKTNQPSASDSQAKGSSRRALLKRALVLLGASVLVQPNGGVSGSGFAADLDKPVPDPRRPSKTGAKKPADKTGALGKAGAKTGLSGTPRMKGAWADGRPAAA